MELEDRPGFFGRMKGWLARERYEDDGAEDVVEQARATYGQPRMIPANGYGVTVRRQVQSFQDAVAAADGLKRGEQQIINLASCTNELREKIKDFMAGVNYAHEGSWEEVGEHVFLLAPPNATVSVAPATPRMQAARN